MKLAGVSPGCTLALTKMARRSGKIQGRWASYLTTREGPEATVSLWEFKAV